MNVFCFRFKMIQHEPDKKNPYNTMALETLNNWRERMPRDGLNNLPTTISDVNKYKTHLHIKVKTSRKIVL